MNTELSQTVARRAALHGALADPARLSIVDALTLGDASPSELGTALGMASNLLAHHLRVLEGTGLVTRSRSEGDQRRSYLRLVPAVLAELNADRPQPVSRVVFVCSANSARSQLACSLWRRASKIPTTSAGTHPATRIHAGAIAAARRHGLPLRHGKPRHLENILRRDDFVITVCDNAHEELAQPPDLHWSIPDPVRRDTPAAFDQSLTALATRIAALAPRLTPSPPPS